jgi:hypothetical protein
LLSVFGWLSGLGVCSLLGPPRWLSAPLYGGSGARGGWLFRLGVRSRFGLSGWLGLLPIYCRWAKVS